MTPRDSTLRSILAAALVALLVATSPATVASGLLDGCQSTATPVGFPAAIAVCPAGDGQTLADVGARIDVVTRDPGGNEVGSIPWQDIWIIGCGERDLCWGAQSSNADAPTDSNGETTISGTIAMGGMHTGVHVYLQAIVVLSQPGCVEPLCLPLETRSVDINGDLLVNLVDLSEFGRSFPPNPYNAAADYDFDGVVGLTDFAIFGAHFGHACP